MSLGLRVQGLGIEELSAVLGLYAKVGIVAHGKSSSCSVLRCVPWVSMRNLI
jgi:hypothetical protein